MKKAFHGNKRFAWSDFTGVWSSFNIVSYHNNFSLRYATSINRRDIWISHSLMHIFNDYLVNYKLDLVQSFSFPDKKSNYSCYKFNMKAYKVWLIRPLMYWLYVLLWAFPFLIWQTYFPIWTSFRQQTSVPTDWPELQMCE